MSFDAAVTDRRLGDGPGCKVVRVAETDLGVPVIAVSGFVAEAFQAAEPLADLYLEKPENPHELVEVMEALPQTRNSDSASVVR